ncbi:hypothetical protein GC197_10460 [bacterium]|nr:hypothetical protein [bacterium]
MKYFYNDEAKETWIDGDDAEEVSLDKALEVWNSLTKTEGSFFGIVGPDELTLQFYWEDSETVSMDIPDPEKGGSLAKASTFEECTAAIKDTFAGQDPRQIEGLEFITW